jgi:RimJ/RimL family protein N-acetyltransferase
VTSALRTSRLLLRQWCDDDIAPFAELSIDPAVMRYLVPFADRAAMDAWVTAARAHWLDRGFGSWVVELQVKRRLSASSASAICALPCRSRRRSRPPGA